MPRVSGSGAAAAAAAASAGTLRWRSAPSYALLRLLLTLFHLHRLYSCPPGPWPMRVGAAVGCHRSLAARSRPAGAAELVAWAGGCRRAVAPPPTRPPAPALLLLPAQASPSRRSAAPPQAAPLEIAATGEPVFEATGVPLVDELMGMRSLDAAAQLALQRAVLVAVGALAGTLLLRAIDRYYGRRIEKKGGNFNALTAAVASAFRPCQVSGRRAVWVHWIAAAVLEQFRCSGAVHRLRASCCLLGRSAALTLHNHHALHVNLLLARSPNCSASRHPCAHPQPPPSCRCCCPTGRVPTSSH